jgi:oxalate decarboxylase/phosphoglucose isomerase-like protein (cupin superfamily)
VFASSGNARTCDVQAGDVGYVPKAMGHYNLPVGTRFPPGAAGKKPAGN